MKCGKFSLDFRSTVIMGVLNVTPDSFSDGKAFMKPKKAILRAKEMERQGAGIIDVGGESSRPGALEISEKEELSRVLPVIKKLAKEISIPISIDTCKPNVANQCLADGASIINDITGLQSKDMIEAALEHDAPVVIMHMKGSPRTMQQNPYYKNTIGEIKHFLRQRAENAKKSGLKKIMLDPGIGFGKALEHNLEILSKLCEFKKLGYPLLVGTSRKSFIGAILEESSVKSAPPSERLEGTLAAVAISVLNGADIVRVHDVLECKKAALVAQRIRDIHG